MMIFFYQSAITAARFNSFNFKIIESIILQYDKKIDNFKNSFVTKKFFHKFGFYINQ